jgi:hypothetical protein
MTYIANPFRIRLAEQQRETPQFLRTFGSEMLSTLPDPVEAWDRLVVLRSAPGAGKTSLLRMLTPAALSAVHAGGAEFGHLAQPLRALGALRPDGPAVLGVLVSLGKDYRALVDLGPAGRGSDIVFFRLLDARILSRFVESVLIAHGLRFPSDSHRIQFSFRDVASGEVAAAAADRLLPSAFPLAPTAENPVPSENSSHRIADPISGRTLLDAARIHEADVLSLLDSLTPVDWETSNGHSRLYTLPFLSGVDIAVDGARTSPRTVLLLDDVHDLAVQQRAALYPQLMERNLNIGRWLAERHTALTDDQLLTDASPVLGDSVGDHLQVGRRHRV